MKYFRITAASPDLLQLGSSASISVINAREVTVASHNTIIKFEETLPENEEALETLSRSDKKKHAETLESVFGTSTLIFETPGQTSQLGYFHGDSDVICALKDEVDDFLESKEEPNENYLFDVNIVLESIIETLSPYEEEEKEEKPKTKKAKREKKVVEEEEILEESPLPLLEEHKEEQAEEEKKPRPVTILRRKASKETVETESKDEPVEDADKQNDNYTLETFFKKDPSN